MRSTKCFRAFKSVINRDGFINGQTDGFVDSRAEFLPVFETGADNVRAVGFGNLFDGGAEAFGKQSFRAHASAVTDENLEKRANHTEPFFQFAGDQNRLGLENFSDLGQMFWKS